MKRILSYFAVFTVVATSFGMIWEEASAQRRRGGTMNRGSVRYSKSRSSYPQRNSRYPSYKQSPSYSRTAGSPGSRNSGDARSRAGDASEKSRNLEDGTYNREGARGGSAEMKQKTEGDTRTREIEGENATRD